MTVRALGARMIAEAAETGTLHTVSAKRAADVALECARKMRAFARQEQSGFLYVAHNAPVSRMFDQWIEYIPAPKAHYSEVHTVGDTLHCPFK